MAINYKPLTKRETDIINVLWESDEPLLASKMAAISELSINTVSAVLKKLMSYELIEVSDIVHSGTVLSRRYRAVIDRDEYLTRSAVQQLKSLKKPLSASHLIATLLEHESKATTDTVISDLETFLQERQKKR